MSRHYVLIPVLLLSFIAACMSQTVHLCPSTCPPPNDGSVSPPPDEEGGTVRVIPQWSEESERIYSKWLNSDNEEIRKNVDCFQAEMKRVIRKGLGKRFPRVEFEEVDSADIIALAMRTRHQEDQSQVAARTESARAYSNDPGPRRLDKIEEQFERTVHTAVNGHNKNLHISGYETKWGQVIYVVEHGVTYCVYNVFVVDTSTTDPEWWKASWTSPTDPKETVTAFLNLMAIVRRID